MTGGLTATFYTMGWKCDEDEYQQVYHYEDSSEGDRRSRTDLVTELTWRATGDCEVGLSLLLFEEAYKLSNGANHSYEFTVGGVTYWRIKHSGDTT